MLRAVLPQQKQNPQLALELLAVASLVQQWQEVCFEAVLLSLLLTKNQENPSVLVKEEEAKSLEGKDQWESPLNYTDPTGLYNLPTGSYWTMQDSRWGSANINGSGDLMNAAGCAVVGMANAVTQKNNSSAGAQLSADQSANPKAILTNPTSFSSPGVDSFDWTSAAQSYGMTAEVAKNTTDNPDLARGLLADAANATDGKYVVVQVPITTSKGVQDHFVNVDGAATSDSAGNGWLNVSGTSENDGPNRATADPTNWRVDPTSGRVQVSIGAVKEAVVLTPGGSGSNGCSN